MQKITFDPSTVPSHTFCGPLLYAYAQINFSTPSTRLNWPKVSIRHLFCHNMILYIFDKHYIWRLLCFDNVIKYNNVTMLIQSYTWANVDTIISIFLDSPAPLPYSPIRRNANIRYPLSLIAYVIYGYALMLCPISAHCTTQIYPGFCIWREKIQAHS